MTHLVGPRRLWPWEVVKAATNVMYDIAEERDMCDIAYTDLRQAVIAVLDSGDIFTDRDRLREIVCNGYAE